MDDRERFGRSVDEMMEELVDRLHTVIEDLVRKLFSEFTEQERQNINSRTNMNKVETFFTAIKTKSAAAQEKCLNALKELNYNDVASRIRSRMHTTPNMATGMACVDHLKSVYIDRIGVELTKWPKLGKHNIYIDVTIARARRLTATIHEEHAMGLTNGKVGRPALNVVTVEELLTAGHGKVVLIEGDPGVGKTTLTFNICKEWATGRLLQNDVVFWVPLRRYHKSVKSICDLFEKLKCAEMKDCAIKNYGKGLVFILDGWDELPIGLQSESFFHDMIFDENLLSHSTIIVTSRPNCSGDIVDRVQGVQTHYQLLGFSPERAKEYVDKEFEDDTQSAISLFAFLKERENLRRHFYIPITVAIMCFVYRRNGCKIPETLSQLYQTFLLLYVRNHIPKSYKKFNSIKKLPPELWSLFLKLCKLAFDMLTENKVIFSEEEFGITEEDVTCLSLESVEQFDGFGLLQIAHTPDIVGSMEKIYCFIHRAVQELLAAVYIWKNEKVEKVIDKHFKTGSFLMNVFPFVFGLVDKPTLSLADKLSQKYIQSHCNRKLLSSILYCLFEAKDDALCREFGKVFCKEKVVTLQLATVLEYRYASYFLSVCGGSKLSVDLSHSTELTELHAEVMLKYFCASSTDVASFKCLVQLPKEGMELFAKVLSYQPKLQSVKLYSIGFHAPGCVKLLCDSICKHNPQLTDLDLPYAKLSIGDLASLGLLLTTSLEGLHMNECLPSEGVSLTCVDSFFNAMGKSKSLKEFCLGGWSLSHDECVAFGDVLSKNSSLKELHGLQVSSADDLCPIIDGLSLNNTVTLLKAWPKSTGDSNTLGQCLGRCLAINQSLATADFACFSDKHILWSSAQVGSICMSLPNNTTLATLDISGCSIDIAASDAVSVMLSSNATLQHFFLNPQHMEKCHAITIISSCQGNTSLKLLSLVKWPGKKFEFIADKGIDDLLLQLKKEREDKNELLIYWEINKCRTAKNKLYSKKPCS